MRERESERGREGWRDRDILEDESKDTKLLWYMIVRNELGSPNINSIKTCV